MTRPVFSLPPASYRPGVGRTSGSLLTGWLAVGRVGLEPHRPLTHWVTTASFLGFPLIPSLQAYLGASKRWLGGLRIEISIGHVVERWNCTTGGLDQKLDVVVDVPFPPMHLRKEAELGIRDRRHVEQRGFPLEALAPRDPLNSDVRLRAGVQQHLQDGCGAIVTRVDGVKEGCMAIEPVLVDRRLRVHVGSHLDEHAGDVRVPILGGHVEQRRADQRRECRHHGRSMVEQ